ncbi:DNA (cytosine-5-)-methyltransferase [uncultured Agrobacterium sp.]|uniref:DNA cytosine methyltransferase n=1 Tax=uncultured Agrobacterium sp. TaxID=157277 RepID=UPI0025E942BB|nr:DNA (cytosine-5-)-methyltransferase [uncultured Agrobacterium sp.]
MNTTADALTKATKRIEALRRQITDRELEIAAEVHALIEHTPTREARQFLKTSCGLGSAEFGVYVKVSRTLKGAEDVLRSGRVQFSVMKSLVALDEDTRAEALTNIAAGAHLGTKDIAALRRRRRYETTPFVVAQERERKAAITSESRRYSSSALSTLEEEVAIFIKKAMELHQRSRRLARRSRYLENDVYLQDYELLKLGGAKLLESFERLFGSGGHTHRWIARAYTALKRFSTGRFSHLGGWSFNEQAGDFEFAEIISALQVLTRRPLRSDWLYRTHPFRETDLTSTPKRLRSLELCAGLGGMAMGMEHAGFDPVALIEIDPDASATMRANRDDWNVIEANIKLVDCSVYCENVDLVTGGVPCQPYSRNGRGLGKNDQRDLFPETVKIVNAVKPKGFVFENVKGFLDAKHADHRASLFASFADAGYEVRVVSIDSKDYGIAQERARVFIVGLRPEYMARFRPPPSLPQWRATLGDALADQMAAGNWSEAAAWADRRRTQVIVRGRKIEIGALASTITGEKRTPQEKEADRWGRREIAVGRISAGPPTDELARLSGDAFMPGLTIEMKLRLMGLPDDLVVVGENASQAQQIGNAVVPRVSQAIGLAVYSAIQGVEFNYETMLRSRPLPYEIVPPSSRSDRKASANLLTSA